MSLYGAETSIRILEKELAEKKSRLTTLTQDSISQSIYQEELEVSPDDVSRPVWSYLHLQRSAFELGNPLSTA